MGENNVCKDFQRNICFRGDRCKFEHPRAPGEDVEAPMKLTFCGQFQGGQCTFRNCHYIHAEKGVEQDYRKYGTLPPEVTRDVIDQYNLCIKYLKGECEAKPCKFKHTNLSLDITAVENLPPKRSREPQSLNEIVKKFDLCKDFINDRCHRGSSCKFSHASPQECGLDEGRGWNGGDGGYGPPDRKRRIMDDGYGQQDSWMRGGGGMGMRGGGGMGMQGGNGMGMGGGMNMPPTPDDFSRLQRENEQLRMENSDLRREMDGLKATNKFLLDETANMRLEAKTGGSNMTNRSPAPSMAGAPVMGGTPTTPGMSSTYTNMPGGYSMAAGGSGYGGMAHQQGSYGGAGAQYGGGVGQQPKPESRYSQGRDEGSQRGGRWS